MKRHYYIQLKRHQSCQLKWHSVIECNKKQSPTYVLVFKTNFKIENEAEKFQYSEPKRVHINLRITVIFLKQIQDCYTLRVLRNILKFQNISVRLKILLYSNSGWLGWLMAVFIFNNSQDSFKILKNFWSKFFIDLEWSLIDPEQ